MDRTPRTIPALIGAVGLVGLVDATVAGTWDLVVVLSAVVVLALALLLRPRRRQPIPIRSDLVRWMADRAAVSGERVEDVADRALAAYRAGFVGDATVGAIGAAECPPAQQDGGAPGRG